MKKYVGRLDINVSDVTVTATTVISHRSRVTPTSSVRNGARPCAVAQSKTAPSVATASPNAAALPPPLNVSVSGKSFRSYFI